MTIVDKKINIIKRRALVSLIFAVSLFFYTDIVVLAKNDEITASGVLELVNAARKEEGLGSLKVNGKLEAAAKEKAEDMLRYEYFSHVSPSGVSPWDLILGQDYDYKYAGENLAIDFFSLSEQHKAWMDSPLHRKNILNPNYKEIGISVKEGLFEGKRTIISVQEFGTTVYGIVENADSLENKSTNSVAEISTENISTSKDHKIEQPLVNFDNDRRALLKASLKDNFNFSYFQENSLSILIFGFLILIIDRLLLNSRKLKYKSIL